MPLPKKKSSDFKNTKPLKKSRTLKKSVNRVYGVTRPASRTDGESSLALPLPCSGEVVVELSFWLSLWCYQWLCQDLCESHILWFWSKLSWISHARRQKMWNVQPPWTLTCWFLFMVQLSLPLTFYNTSEKYLLHTWMPTLRSSYKPWSSDMFKTRAWASTWPDRLVRSSVSSAKVAIPLDKFFVSLSSVFYQCFLKWSLFWLHLHICIITSSS